MKAWTLDLIQANCMTEGDCWIWQAGCKTNGKHATPICRHEGKVITTRRLVRELADGKPVPRWLEVSAKCRNRMCVSPECSRKVSTSVRCQMAAPNTSCTDPAAIAKRMLKQRARSRFSDAVIEQVRVSSTPAKQVAAETGMSTSHVNAVRSGRLRRALGNPFEGLMA